MASILLIIYILQFIPLSYDLFEQHAHHTACSELTVEQEKDTCHQSIYHNNDKNNCGHRQHIEKEQKACETCSYISNLFNSHNFFSNNYSNKLIVFDGDSYKYISDNFSLETNYYSNLFNKGPPQN